MNFLQRLFSEPKTPQPANAAPAANPSAGQLQPGQRCPLPPGLQVGRLTDLGKERDRNEDSYFAFEAMLQYDDRREPFGLFIVADGMGGHQKGEEASSLAARVAASYLAEHVYVPYLYQAARGASGQPINEALINAVENANLAVQQTVPDGGTTLTAALVMGSNVYIAHVGDSRAYLFRQGDIKQITRDHSLAQRLEELGQGTSDQLAGVQNVLYRAVGQNSTVEVDTFMQPLAPGSSLLLCSDGLWGLVPAASLKAILTAAATPQDACRQMVAAANQAGGHDNITAIVVTMGEEKTNGKI
jgi:serine/threonine protein phosphatase PrpC